MSRGKEFSKLLLKTLQCIRKDIKEMRRESHEDPSTRFVHEEGSTSSYYGCEHSATPPYLQCFTRPMITKSEKEKGAVPKKETLGDYLQEYESQSKRFTDHLNFQGFFKIKEDKRPRNHDEGIFFLSTFDGSPKCSVRAWVEELDTYLQQHQVSEDEAIRVAALHLEGKSCVWWFCGSSSLKYVNISTYSRFTRRVVERFNEKKLKHLWWL